MRPNDLIIRDLDGKLKAPEKFGRFLNEEYLSSSEIEEFSHMIKELESHNKSDEIDYLLSQAYLTMYFAKRVEEENSSEAHNALKKAISYLNAITFARDDLDVVLLKAELYYYLGEDNFNNLNLQDSYGNFCLSLELFKTLEETIKTHPKREYVEYMIETFQVFILNIYYYCGILRQDEKEYDEAIEFFKKGLSVYEKYKDNPIIKENYKTVGRIYHSLANTCADKKQYENALDFFEKAFDVFEGEADYTNFDILAAIWMDIGTVYKEMGDFEKAKDCFNQSIEKWQDLKREGEEIRESELAMAYTNRGNLFLDINELDKALEDYETAEQILRRAIEKEALLLNLYKEDLARVLFNKGILFKKKKINDKAIRFFDDALNIIKNLPYENDFTKAFINNVEKEKKNL